jgi:hypothetical protein
MGVFDPDALDAMRDIYRDVLQELSKLSMPLTDRLRDEIAQEVLHAVRSGDCDRAEIVASLCARATYRQGQVDRLPNDDPDPNLA